MGTCSSVSISNLSVRLDEAGKYAYNTGDTISGAVEFINTDTTELKFNSISGQFIGKCVYYTRRAVRNGEVITSYVFPLLSVPLISSSVNEQQQRTLSPGKHVWPFSVNLPKYLPPSIPPLAQYGQYIEYYMNIEIVRPEIFRSNLKQKFVFLVQNTSFTESGTRIEDQKENRNGVRVCAYFDSNVAVVGTTCRLHFEIDNPHESTIRRISAELIQSRKFFIAQKQQLTILKQEMSDTQKLKGKQIHAEMDIVVPSMLPATYPPRSIAWSQQHQITIDYRVRIELHLFGFFTNIELELPIIIVSTPPARIDTPSKQESIPLTLE